jgi:hypothetical protein
MNENPLYEINDLKQLGDCNPFVIFDLKLAELSDLDSLNRAKLRILAKAKLSFSGRYEHLNLSISPSVIEEAFKELSQPESIDMYASMQKYPELNAFFAVIEEFSVAKILTYDIWAGTKKRNLKVNAYFTNHYANWLKGCIVVNNRKILKQLIVEDKKLWKEFDLDEIYGPAKEHLSGILIYLKSSISQKNWLNLSETELLKYCETNFSPETLNLLPNEFQYFRDEFAYTLIFSAKPYRTKAPLFFNQAQKIALQFNLSNQGKAKVQKEIDSKEQNISDFLNNSLPKNVSMGSQIFDYIGSYFKISFILMGIVFGF